MRRFRRGSLPTLGSGLVRRPVQAQPLRARRGQLWEQLEDYVKSLDEDQFRRSLVFPAPSVRWFQPPGEKRHIAENLGECWGMHADTASELMEQELTEQEEQTLSDLNEFDFDDL